MGDIRVYSRDELALRPAVEGAKMWAIGLDRSMLTYFELEPDTTFPDHSHESEQITLVLEGELTFVFDGKSVTLKAGDAVAIPSNKIHSAHTGKRPCRAVDAWSPVRREFLFPAGRLG
ncbi:MAG: cupin domain-containing protein [Deltaproteobacteria bacterium]|nr:cupin domain-containing protein [Deltaproteobacteria bacterium]